MGTWEIVDTPLNANLVDSKIVLRLKLDADGIPSDIRQGLSHEASLSEKASTSKRHSCQ